MRIASVIPIADYVAINLKKDLYLPLSSSDIRVCLHDKTDMFLCYVQRPIYHLKNDENLCLHEPHSKNCQVSITSCANQWTETSKLNKYLFFCCTQCKLRILYEQQVTLAQLTEVGILSIDQGCIIKTDNFTVYSHKDQLSEFHIKPKFVNTEEIEPINHLLHIDIPFVSAINESSSNMHDLEEIRNQITILKKHNTLPEQISYHDIHHYSVIYGVLGVISTLALAIIFRRIKQRRRVRTTVSGEASLAQASIELQMYPAAAAGRPAVEPRVSECVERKSPKVKHISACCDQGNMGNFSKLCVSDDGQCLNECKDTLKSIKVDKCTSPIVKKTVFN